MHGVLGEAGDEGCPGDEVGAGHGVEEAERGRDVGAVGVHCDEVVGEEGGGGGGAGEHEAGVEAAAEAEVAGAAA